MYVKSDKIKFYPSAYRYYMDNGVSVVTDEEASKNTEYNITSHIAKIFHSTKGSFVVSDNNDTDLEFYIGGYYVKIEDVATNLFSGFSSDLDIYANIKLALVTPPPTQGNWDNLYEVVEFENEYKPLDYQVSSDVVFEGISFETSANANATYSLHLYTRGSTTDLFRLVTLSTYSLKLSDIIGNLTTGVGADSEIKTGSLIATGFLYVGTNGSCITTSNNGDFVLNRNILFDNNQYQIGDPTNQVGAIYSKECTIGTGIYPKTGTETIGTSSSKFNTVYANNFYGDLEGAQAILSSALLPKTSDGANIGASNRKFAKIYASKFYGNLEGQTIDVVSNLLPKTDRGANIGASDKRFEQLYAREIYGAQLTLNGGIVASSNGVDIGVDTQGGHRIRNVISTNARSTTCYTDYLDAFEGQEVKLKTNLLPNVPNSYTLGDSSNALSAVYANSFYGAFNGNATSATKLNVTNVGNRHTPVFFNSGVPSNCAHHIYNQLTNSSYIEIQSSSDGLTPIYRSSGNVFTLKKGVYHFTFTTTAYNMFKNVSATVATIVIPEDKTIGLISENSTVYTVDSFFSWYYYDSNWTRQQWLYTRLKLRHTTGSNAVDVYLQLGVGYYSGSSLQLTWSDVNLTSVTATHFD